MRQPGPGPFRSPFTERSDLAGNGWPGPGLAVLGALLDRSLALIEDAAVDARRFDRQTIRSVTDVWDNLTFPLFRAATASTPEGPEQRARAALEWMAGFSAQRRAWMREQAEAAGHALDPLLPPARHHARGRDYRGFVRPLLLPVTSETAIGLAADYDLASATVRSLLVERDGPRLNGFVRLAVDRIYSTGDETPAAPAVLELRLEGVEHVAFDSHDARGAVLEPSGGATAIGIGAHGALRAARAEAYPDDRSWHLSSAGRRADVLTPPRGEASGVIGPPRGGELGGAAKTAATLLRLAMLEIRTIRYPEYAGRVPIPDFCRAFAGAGEAVLAAKVHRGPRRGEAAFRDLVNTWVQRGGPRLARWFAAHVPQEILGDVILPGHTDGAARRTPAQESPARRAELRMASYGAAHVAYGTEHAASAHFHLALPGAAGGPWRLRALRCAEPSRFRLRTEALNGAGRAHLSAGEGAGRTFALHDGAFEVSSGDTAWDVDLR